MPEEFQLSTSRCAATFKFIGGLCLGALLLGAFVAASCFSPDFNPGLACSETGLCPSGQNCENRVCVLGSGISDGSTPMSDGTIGECGNGVREDTEACDDGNETALDGCSTNCATEAGYSCAGEPSVCSFLSVCPSQNIVAGVASFGSCKEYFDAGYRASGRYLVDADGAGVREAFPVLCDMATGGGGWTIVVNNVADAIEPEGCMPRLATLDAFACGSPSCEEDFSTPVYGMPFTELAWVEHDDEFNLLSHNVFRWSTSQSLPNLGIWSLSADLSNLKLTGLEAHSLIDCRYMNGAVGLVRVANENPRINIAGFTTSDVVTFFDQDNTLLNPGRMSFTDPNTAGLDDFKDGFGCESDWQPISQRGAATLVMIR